MDLRVAAYAVIESESGVLLSHWALGDRWTLPGGGIDPGEHPVDAVVREVLEETGYVCAVHELLLVDSIVTPAAQRMRAGERALHSLRIVYRASVVSGDLAHELDGSSDEARWVLPERLAELDHVSLIDQSLAAAHESRPEKRPLRLH